MAGGGIAIRADGMGRGVARLYAKRREAMDQYVPQWLGPGQGREAPGQGGQPSGQGGFSSKPLQTKAGQGGQGKQGTQTTTGENTAAHIADVSPREEQHQQAVRLHGPNIHPVHLVHPVPASNGAGLLGQGIAPPLCPPCPWTDIDSWCARLGALPTVAERRVVLREWVDAAGGWSDAAAVHLPVCLPAGLAQTWLKTLVRSLRLDVREDH